MTDRSLGAAPLMGTYGSILQLLWHTKEIGPSTVRSSRDMLRVLMSMLESSRGEILKAMRMRTRLLDEDALRKELS